MTDSKLSIVVRQNPHGRWTWAACRCDRVLAESPRKGFGDEYAAEEAAKKILETKWEVGNIERLPHE